MKMLRFVLIVLCMSMMAPAFAKDGDTANMDILREKMKADKKLVVAANMGLTDAEGQKFWPIYEGYQRDLKKVNEQMLKVITAYADAYNKGPLSDSTAKNLLRDAMDVEEAELKLKRKYAPIVEKSIGAAKAARYMQVESKIRAALKYEMADQIPLVK
jgi:tryptophan 2,3-dioxygenase